MAGAAAGLIPSSKSFTLGPAQITVAGDPAAMQAVLGNQPFPNWSVALGNVSVTAGQDITFATPAGPLHCNASGGLRTGIGLYTDAQKVVADLGLADELAQGLTLPQTAGMGFCVFLSSIDARASAQGSVALGSPATLTFGVDGSAAHAFAVVRQFPTNTPAAAVLSGTFGNWKPPSTINGVNDLDCGTWIAAEVEGKLAIALAASYGYDFTWVRQAALGQLSGDISLKLNAAIKAALSFTAEGKYCVVVSREPEDCSAIRLRIFKLKKKGWAFSFNGGLDAKVDKNPLPGTFDDFLKAVFGVHGQQILNDLHAVQDWTDPARLPDKLAGLGLQYFKKFLADITGDDPNVLFETVKNRLTNLLAQWDALPARVASVLWQHLPNADAVKSIADLAKSLAAPNQDTVKALLEPLLQKADFFTTPRGQWLEAAAEGGLLDALTGTRAFQDFQSVAKTTAALLDGSKVQTLLTNLQQKIDVEIGKLVGLTLPDGAAYSSFQSLEDAIKDLTPGKLDQWLRAKLEALLEKPIGGIADLQKAHQLIVKIAAAAPAIYDKARQALEKTYSFSLSATYQAADAGTALIDASFDLAQPAAAQMFKDLVGGSYDEFVAHSAPGVRLRAATLTHNVSRRRHVEVSLPFYKSTTEEIMNSLARVNAVDEADGRVLIYELQAEDEVVTRNRRDSRLSIAAFYPTSGVRKYGPPSMSCNYSFEFQQPNMKRAALEWQVRPYVDAYFPNLFHDAQGGVGSFSEWVGDVDKYADVALRNGTDTLGDARLTLQVAFPTDLASFWLRLDPQRAKANLPAMSESLQSALRMLILSYYFADPNRFTDTLASCSVLVYAALPIATGASQGGNGLIFSHQEQYWEYLDRGLRRAMIADPHTSAKLAGLLARLSDVVNSMPSRAAVRPFFRPDNTGFVQSLVLQQSDAVNSALITLLTAECKLIETATRAVKDMVGFLQNRDRKPAEAVAMLTEFGEDATRAFNSLSNYTGDAVRPLGPVLLGAMAQALAPELALSPPSAMLTVAVMNKGAVLPALDQELKTTDVVLQQRLVSL